MHLESLILPPFSRLQDYICNVRRKLISYYSTKCSVNLLLFQEYANQVRTNASLCSTEFGRNYYATVLRQLTTSLTPDQIHKIGFEEIARIEAEMDKIRIAEGFNGSLQDFRMAIQSNREMRFNDEVQ
jgi:uncharacterized protein (DUF885 family)